MAPTRADKADETWTICEEIGEMMVYETKISGAIFWRVIKIMQCAQEAPCMMGGNQKWTGAAPIFRRSAPKIRKLGLVRNNHMDVALIRIIADPRA